MVSPSEDAPGEMPAHVRHHLRQVYSTLMFLLGAAACGCMTNLYFRLPNFLMALLTFGCVMWFMMVPAVPENLQKRMNLLLGFAFCSGASVSLLIEMASLRASEWTVLWALGATSIMFACFSLSALLARRRSYLFLGGILSSAMSMMFWFGMASMFFPNRASYMIQLYGGLLLFSGYVLYDSQVIVERAYTMNKPDVLADSLKLFTDFMALLRRVLIILMQREQRKDDRRRQQHQPQFRMNAGMMGPTAHSRRSYGYSY